MEGLKLQLTHIIIDFRSAAVSAVPLFRNIFLTLLKERTSVDPKQYLGLSNGFSNSA